MGFSKQTYQRAPATLANLLALFALLFTHNLFASQSQVQRGEQLYLENCSTCHGNQGKGGMGIPLSIDSFLNSASNQYLKKTIRLGRPERIMPSFYWLAEKDIDAIIEFISTWRNAPAPVWNQAAIKGEVQSGKALFTQHCASCHGSKGQGGTGSGMRFSRPRDLPITAPALNNQGFLNSIADEMLHYIISHGRKETPMPAATSLGLDKQEINDLVSYIRSFQQQTLRKKPLYHEEPASLIVDSPYSFDETIENVKRAITGSNFVHIRDQALTDGFKLEPSADSKQTVIYFCSFSFLYEALKIDPRVGMFLPCRITVTETKGKVQMMSINPRHLSQLFNNNELDTSCSEMHDVYTSILEDASL